MVTKLIMVSQYIHISDHFVIYLKLMQSYVNYISVNLEVGGCNLKEQVWGYL